MVHFIESFGNVNLSNIDLTTFPEDRMRLIPGRPEGWRLFDFPGVNPWMLLNRMCIVKGFISSRTSEYLSRCREWLLDDYFLTLPASPVLIHYGDNAYSTVFRYWGNFPPLKDLLGRLGGFSNNVRASNPSRRSYLLLDPRRCKVVLAFSQHHFLTVDSSFWILHC